MTAQVEYPAGTDPHRGKCWWDGKEDQTQSGWFSLLDWSVYHAPGWSLWQEFRASLVGQAMPLRAHRVSEWWSEAVSPCAGDGEQECYCDPADQLADAVRCVNVLRSLRGQFSAHPELRELLDRLNPELEARWTPRG